MDTPARIACCVICTLATVMKDCQACPFGDVKALADQQRAVKDNSELGKQEEIKP